MKIKSFTQRVAAQMRSPFTGNPDMKLHSPGEFISDSIRLTRRHYEVRELNWVRKEFDCTRVIDIGANIGNHCNYFSRFGAIGWAFEPSGLNFELLKANAPGFDCHQVALANFTGTAQFVTYESCMGNSYLQGLFSNAIQPWGVGPGIELVEVRTLDSFNIQEPTLVKIDVEGAELKVLQGATSTLEKYCPTVWIEIHTDETLEAAGFPYRSVEIHTLLTSLGYQYVSSYGLTNHFFTK